MKAIIMAGGEGSRLRPLTCDCPKPMMRLMDRPVMQYALELLRAHGITRIAATLGYLPDAISDYFGDGADFGVDIKYSIEQTPMGTAGGVKQVSDFLDETFIVLSGDGVTDLDITSAVAFHRSHRALATLVLRREENPSEYGVVSTDGEGRVNGFYEKPGRCDVLSDTINTGIYILEPEVLDKIPSGEPYDFGHDLFPQLVREGAPVFGYVMNGYWCDIGDVRAYLGAHIAAMDGAIHLENLTHRPGRTVIMPGASVDRTAILEPPCLVASGAQVRAGAHIGPYSVVGENCIVGPHASLKRAILWPGAQVEAHAQARGCVLGAHALLGAGAQAYEESVLGTGASAGERATILPGVKLWPGKGAADGERLEFNLVWGSRRAEGFAAGSFALSSPAQATRAAQACASVLKPRELLLGRGASTVADALWHAVAAGIMAQGIQIVDAGVCTLPQLRHAQALLRTDAAMLVTDRRLIPLSANGARLSAKVQRAINTMNARHDYSGPFTGLTRPVLSAGQTEIAYIADAAACFEADPKCAQKIAIHAQNPHLLSIAERAFSRAGLSVRAGWEDDMMDLAPGELGVWLDDRGETAVLSDERSALNEAEQQLMYVWSALECGERELLLPVSATRAAAELANRYHARTVYVAGETSMWMNALADQSPFQFMLWFDGVRSALCALSLLTEKELTLETWRRAMPCVHRRTRTVDVPVSETGRILHTFAARESDVELGGGVRFKRDGGWAWICPDEQRPEFRIVAESANAEFARELCDFCERELRELAEPASENTAKVHQT